MPYIKFVPSKLTESKYPDPHSLSQELIYLSNSNKTFQDSVRRKNIGFIGPYCGCEPFFFPIEEEKNIDSIYEMMMFALNVFPHVDRNIFLQRIISFHPATPILPQDLDSLGRKISKFYADNGHICAYFVHADKPNPHLHFVVCNVNSYTGNQLNISYEYNIISSICENFENLLLENHEKVEYNSLVLYGSDLKYGDKVGFSASDQININSKR